MASGGKGSSPAGNTTTTTTNPSQAAQLPYLQSGWNGATDALNNNSVQYTPYDTLAAYDPAVKSGYDALESSGWGSVGLNTTAANSLTDTLGGGQSVQQSPAYSTLNSLASGTAPSQGALGGTANDLRTLAYQPDANYTAGTSSLAKTAAGDYLNANPYLDKMYDSASRGVTRAYQTATAPQTDSTYEKAGRYGSGSLGNAVSQNNQDLGVSLDSLASDIYGKNYATERGYQNTAANNLGTLGQGQQKLQGSILDAAGGLYGNLTSGMNTGASTLQGGYDKGNTNTNVALGLVPGTLDSFYTGAKQVTNAGLGRTGQSQAQIDDYNKRFYGTEQAPWYNLQQYMNLIGQPTSGSSSMTSPYFQNGTANLLGTATGGLGLYNGVSNTGLFGGGAGAASTGLDFGGGGAGMGVADSVANEWPAAAGGLLSFLGLV